MSGFDFPGGLSPETEELLRRARAGERMPATHKRRLKGAVLARTAFAAVTLAAGQVAGSAVMGAGFVAKAVIGVAIVGSLGAGSYLALRPARHHAPATASRAVAVRAPKVIDSPAPPTVVEPPAPVVAPPVHAHRPVPRRAPAVETSDLAAETALLRDADRALRAGDTATAIARLDEHATRYPKGALAPERTAERLIVMCELGVADSRQVAQFLAARSGSPLAARVRRACPP